MRHHFFHNLDVFPGPDPVAFEIDEKELFLGVIDEPLLKGEPEDLPPEVHGLVSEYPGIHELGLFLDDRSEFHAGQDVPLDVDARSHLHELHAVLRQCEDAALGDVVHRLVGHDRVAPAEGDMLNLPEELFPGSFLPDFQKAVVDRHLQAVGGEGPHEHHFPGVLADVDETPRPCKPVAEFAHVEISLLIGLGQPEKAAVEPAPVIEIELIGLIDDAVCIDGRTKAQAPRRKPADDPGLGRKRDVLEDLLLMRDAGDPFRHADAEIDDAVAFELEGGPAGDDLASACVHDRERLHGDPHLAAVIGIVLDVEGLPVVFGSRNDNTVHQNARDLDLAGVQRSALSDTLHLDDNESSRVLGSHGNREGFLGECLLLHSDVAVRVSGRSAKNRHIDGKGLVREVIPAIKAHDLHQILFCDLVDLAASETGVHIGPHAVGGQRAGFVSRDVPKHVGDDSLGEIVGLDLVLYGEPAELGGEAPVAAHDAPDKALVAEAVEPPLPAVALACGIYQGQVPGPACFEINFLDLSQDFFRNADAHETAGSDCVSVLYGPHRIFRRHDFASAHARGGQGGEHRVSAGIPWCHGFLLSDFLVCRNGDGVAEPRPIGGFIFGLCQEEGSRWIRFVSWNRALASAKKDREAVAVGYAYEQRGTG